MTNTVEVRRCPECGGVDDYPIASPLSQSCTTCETVQTMVPAAQGVSFGWQCPGCGRCYSPYVATCGACQPPAVMTTSTTPFVPFRPDRDSDVQSAAPNG